MGKGQVSLEYLIIVGLMFLMLMPLLYVYATAQKDATDTLTEGQLRKAGTTLRDASERVYYAGTPAQERIEIYLPDNIRQINLTDTGIAFNVSGGAVYYEVVIASTAPLNGTIATSRGPHVLTIKAMDGYVQVEE